LKLGGAMRLTAKWHNKEKINNTDESVWSETVGVCLWNRSCHQRRCNCYL
jgi:hypothetical protein